MKVFTLCIIAMVSLGNYLFSQDFSGKYSLNSELGVMKLELEQSGDSIFSGELSGNGIVMPVHGKIQNNVLVGIVGTEMDALNFEASLTENELLFTTFEKDENGQQLGYTSQSFMFQRIKSAPNSALEQTTGKESVIINNSSLTGEQIQEIKKMYGAAPLPGNYWYDAKSGLYGVVGYAAYGFMLPGHEWGGLRRDVSNGNTGVIINNRELPMNEYTVWSYMLGYWIQPGSYWLDEKGNAGYEGNPTPVVNLYQAAQQNAYQGRGGSGDNFWSSRFGSGNYDAGNQSGYVSVPGYGPVGYGF